MQESDIELLKKTLEVLKLIKDSDVKAAADHLEALVKIRMGERHLDRAIKHVQSGMNNFLREQRIERQKREESQLGKSEAVKKALEMVRDKLPE